MQILETWNKKVEKLEIETIEDKLLNELNMEKGSDY